MDKTSQFGDLHAASFAIGDIVEWSKWNSKENDWNYFYGIILEIKKEFRANRLISISKVMPLNNMSEEREFFTISLRLVSDHTHLTTHKGTNNEES